MLDGFRHRRGCIGLGGRSGELGEYRSRGDHDKGDGVHVQPNGGKELYTIPILDLFWNGLGDGYQAYLHPIVRLSTSSSSIFAHLHVFVGLDAPHQSQHFRTELLGL